MKSASQWISQAGLLAVAVLAVGCGNRLEELKGTYYGDLSVIQNGRLNAHRVTTRITSKSRDGNELRLAIRTVPQKERAGRSSTRVVSTFSLKMSGSKIVIESNLIPAVAGRNEVVIRDRGACGQEEPEAENAPSLTIVCATKDVISLFATDPAGRHRALLYMSKTGANVHSAVPKNGRFTLDTLFKMVRETSFENRLAAERLYQAFEEVKLVRSRLIPSFSAGTILSLANNWMQAAFSIGSLAPFIFPSHWYDFSAQKTYYQAEVLSYKTLVANQMNLAEDIYHGIIRDQNHLGRLRRHRSRLIETRDLIAEYVGLGLAPSSDLIDYEELIHQNDNDQSRLRHLIRSQFAVLSRGIGLSPRNGIRALVPRPLPRLDRLRPLSSEDLMAEALGTSLEIQQLLFMERTAEHRTESVFWSFLNPSGWIGFSAGIFHEHRIAKSRIQEVRMLRGQAEASIQEQVIGVASLHNHLLEQNRILDRSIENRRKSIELLEERYRSGTVTALQLRSATENLIRLEAEKASAESALAIVLGKVERLMMRGPYQRVHRLLVRH